MSKVDNYEAPKTIDTIAAIARRAVNVNPSLERVSTMMDIDAVHKKTPLRLSDMLTTTDFNLMHDIYGIAENLNRTTKKLENCFSPRFTI